MLWKVTKNKGSSAGAIHHLCITATVPTLLRGSKAWWTGARHIVDQVAPTYHTMARTITGLPKWTPTHLLLKEAGLPPLDLLLDCKSQQYGVRVLLLPDTYPCKRALTLAMTQPSSKNQAGFIRIAHLVQNKIVSRPRLESTQTNTFPLLPPPHVKTQMKNKETAAHQTWIATLPPGTILLYTDGSKSAKGETSSAWHCIEWEPLRWTTLFEGKCSIGTQEDIEDGEIHAIQDGQRELAARGSKNCKI